MPRAPKRGVHKPTKRQIKQHHANRKRQARVRTYKAAGGVTVAGITALALRSGKVRRYATATGVATFAAYTAGQYRGRVQATRTNQPRKQRTRRDYKGRFAGSY